MQSIFQVGYSLADLFRDPLALKSADPNSIQKLAAELDSQLDARAFAFKNADAGAAAIDAEFQAVFDKADIRTRLLPSSVAHGSAAQTTGKDTPSDTSEDSVFVDDAILQAIETGEIKIDDLVAPGTPLHEHLKTVLSARLPANAPTPTESRPIEGSDAQLPSETLKNAIDAPAPTSSRSEVTATALAPPAKVTGLPTITSGTTREAPTLAPEMQKASLTSPLNPTSERIRFAPSQPLSLAVPGTAPEVATDQTHLPVKAQGDERSKALALPSELAKTHSPLPAKTTPKTTPQATPVPPDPTPALKPLVISAQTGVQGPEQLDVHARENLSPPHHSPSPGSPQPLTTREAASARLRSQTPLTADGPNTPMADPARMPRVAGEPAQKIGVSTSQTAEQILPREVARQTTATLHQTFASNADGETMPQVNLAGPSKSDLRPVSVPIWEFSAVGHRETFDQSKITNTPSPALKAADGPGLTPRTLAPSGMPVTVSYVPSAHPPASETMLKPRTLPSTMPQATDGPAPVTHASTAQVKVGRGPATATPAIDPEAPSRTHVDPFARAPVEPLARTPVDPLTRSPVAPLARAAVGPLARTPVEPSGRTAVDPLARSSVDPLARAPVEALARTPAGPLARPPLQTATDQAARAQSGLLQGADRARKSATAKLTPEHTPPKQPAQNSAFPAQATLPTVTVEALPASTIRVDASQTYQSSADAIPSEPGQETAAREARAASAITPGAQLPTAHMAKAPPPHIAQQIAVAIQNRTSGTFEITLSPAELGNVRISLTSADTGMIVNIHAERPETLDLIRRNADILAEDFRDLGYDGTSFSFEGSDQRKQGPGSKPEVLDQTAGDLQDTGVTTPPDPHPKPSHILSDGTVDIRI